jgi:tetratricopeptide (TPR) repeat protein
MRTHTARKLIGALLLGAVALVSTAGPASAQLEITNPDLAAPVQEATTAATAGNYTAAIAAMRRAEQVAGITGAERAFIQQSILAYLVQARQYPQALTQVEAMLAANIGNRNQNLESALRLSLNTGNTAKAEQYAQQLGRPGDIAIFSAQAAYDRGDHDECIRLATPLAAGNQPAQGVLQLLSACYFAKQDVPGQRRILEQLALHYPTPEIWDALMRNVRNSFRGLNDEQSLELARIDLATGGFSTPTDYSEMAQLAIIAQYPGEAHHVLELANEAGLLEGERSQRLITMTDERMAIHQGQMANAVTGAANDPTGFVAMKLGQAYLSYQQYDEAEAALRSAIQKGVTGENLQMTQIALGRALLGKGDTAGAVQQFNAVEGYNDNNANAVIARLWSIYARQ